MSTLSTFMEITGCPSQTVAERCLRKHNYSINRAIDDYFQNIESTLQLQYNKQPENPEVVNIFKKYADNSNQEIIDIDGTIQYFNDLNIDFETDIRALIAACVLNSTNAGEFKRESFVSYWSQQNVSTIAGMSQHLHDISQNGDIIEKTYKFAFNYTLEHKKKKLPVEEAIALWSVFFSKDLQNPETTAFKFINDYIATGKSGKTDITRDEWMMAYEFFQIPLSDLKKHTENAAWPVLMDEFVDLFFNTDPVT